MKKIEPGGVTTIKKLSTLKNGIPLTEFKGEGLIADINLNIGLFERLIGMGIYSGEKIRADGEIPNEIGLALERDLVAYHDMRNLRREGRPSEGREHKG